MNYTEEKTRIENEIKRLQNELETLEKQSKKEEWKMDLKENDLRMPFQEKKDYLRGLSDAIKTWYELNCPVIDVKHAEKWLVAFSTLNGFWFSQERAALLDYLKNDYQRKITIEKIEDFFLLIEENFYKCYDGDMPEKVVISAPRPKTREDLKKRIMPLTKGFFKLRLEKLRQEKKELEEKIRQNLKNGVKYEGEAYLDDVGIGLFDITTNGRYSAISREIAETLKKKYEFKEIFKALFSACEFTEAPHEKDDLYFFELK